VEPVKGVRTERQKIWIFGGGRKLGAPKDLYRHQPWSAGQIQLHALCKARQVGDHQHLLVLKLTDERQHFAVARIEKLQTPASEGAKLLALLNQTLRPPQQRMRIVLLCLDVDGFVVIFGIDIHRQIQALRIGAREPGIAV
jgi:hypothetical protein